ncbi:MAG TPA: hypothetical protein PK961_01185 [bacterium]|nr:hypothetical protein [bacterium]
MIEQHAAGQPPFLSLLMKNLSQVALAENAAILPIEKGNDIGFGDLYA